MEEVLVTNPEGKRFRVQAFNETLFRVASGTKLGEWHYLWIARDYGCDCKGFHYRGRCTHLYAAAVVRHQRLKGRPQ